MSLILEQSKRQHEILNVAGGILMVSGMNGLTIKNLSIQMNISESAICRYFKNKEEIITAMLEKLANSMENELANCIRVSDPPQKRFKALFHAQFSFFQNHQHMVIAIFSEGLLMESNYTKNQIVKLLNLNMKYLMPILMEGQQKGVFINTITTEELMHIVMGAFRFRMLKWRIANFQFNINRYGGFMIQSLLTVIKRNECR